jgi:hypothetical protein
MTGCALVSTGIGELAMEAGIAGDVFADVFVTVKAKFSLFRSTKRFVTRRTLRFEFGMTFYEFSGHDQRFNALCAGSLAIYASQHCYYSSYSESTSFHSVDCLVHMYSQHM